MAQMKGWKPTKRVQYLIWYGDEDLDIASGESPADAVKTFVKNHADSIDGLAVNHGVSKEEFIVALRAKIFEPDADEDGGLQPRDIKSINSEKTRATIEQWLNTNSLPYDIIFQFGEGDETGTVQPTPDAITFVKTGNAGRDALTPHMILHTFGHAVVGSNTEELESLIGERLQQITGQTFPNVHINYESKQRAIIALCKLLHMKAAEITLKDQKSYMRGRGFPTLKEAIYEIMAIYVRNGQIKIGPNKYCDFPAHPEQCNALKALLERHCKKYLDRCVGKVVYDD